MQKEIRYLLILGMLFSQAGWAKDSWSSKMSDLSSALSDVIPELFSKETSRQEAADLKRKTERLYNITKNLDPKSPHSVKAPDKDPALPYIAQLLNENFDRANKGLEQGHIEFAKAILRSSVSYCIACHTRTQTGPEFPLLKAFAKPLQNASWIDRISFETASRQFDPVYNSVMTQLKTGLGSNITSMDLDKASRMALAISIRVKKNPEQAIVLSKAIADSPYTSELLKKDARVWLTDLKAWQTSSEVYKTDEQLIKAARELIGPTKGEWAPHSEVKYLRASVMMHDLLRQYPSSPHIGESLYLIGLTYNRLNDLGLWSLHEMYFQACIKKVPHSELAEKCYQRYEENVTFGYTGSRGTTLPPEVDKQLKALKQLAFRSKK